MFKQQISICPLQAPNLKRQTANNFQTTINSKRENGYTFQVAGLVLGV